jgi:hypothetical protein
LNLGVERSFGYIANDPNGLPHWNFHLNPDWSAIAAMLNRASASVPPQNFTVCRMLGGIPPIEALPSHEPQ